MNLHCLLQEQGHNVVLPDADNTFHAIKVTAVHYSFAFFLLFTFCNLHQNFILKLELLRCVFVRLGT